MCTMTTQPSTSKLSESCVEFRKKREGLLTPGKRKIVHNNEVSVKRGSTVLVGLRKQPTFCHHCFAPQNDVWGTREKIPYWCCDTIQIWVVLLIGHAVWETCFDHQKHYPDLGSDAPSVWNFCFHFARKPVAMSRNVTCFLKLNIDTSTCIWLFVLNSATVVSQNTM